MPPFYMSFFCSQRARKGAVRSNCRNPRDMGAIEIALRTSEIEKISPYLNQFEVWFLIHVRKQGNSITCTPGRLGLA